MDGAPWYIAHFFEITGYLLAIILIPRILLERRHPGATIAWVLAIGLIPLLGVPLYLLIGGRRVKKISKKKGWVAKDEMAQAWLRNDDFLPPDNRKVAGLLMNSGMFPPTLNNRISIIDDGIKAYNTLVSLIENAGKSIEIATFILGRDEVGHRIVEMLAHKASQGIEVRLLLDAVGCLRTSGSFVRPIIKAGGHVKVFLPILSIRRRWSANLRNHRKIMVVDNRKALVGGMNLAGEYIGPATYKKRWKDVAMLITGGSVGHLRTIFRQDWVFSEGDEFEHCPQCLSSEGENGSIMQVVGDGPDIPERPLYSGVLAALSQARERIWVVTPYFVPDEPLSATLGLAARMGLDVRLIIPEKSNHPLVDLAGDSFLPVLIAAGVRLYKYQPGMLHAKLIAVDGRLAVLGSANMDIRSFQLNFEVAAFLYARDDVRQVVQAIEKILKDSIPVTLDKIENKSRFREFSEDICRVFSPLL